MTITGKEDTAEKFYTTTRPAWPMILDIPPIYLTTTGPTTRPPTPAPLLLVEEPTPTPAPLMLDRNPAPTPIPPLTAAQKAEALLNLLLSRVQEQPTSGCNIPSIAQALVQQYKHAWTAGEISFAELKNRYLARYNEAERDIRRMDRLGELILTLQNMLLTDPDSALPPHHHNPSTPPFRHPHHHHHRRRPGKGMELKRVAKTDDRRYAKEA